MGEWRYNPTFLTLRLGGGELSASHPGSGWAWVELIGIISRASFRWVLALALIKELF
jgi:hypothetical protein